MLNIKNNKNCNIKINDNTISTLSAKEMFEELGYECDESCDGILYAKYIDSDRCGVEQHSISFDKVDKTIEKYVGAAGFSHKNYRAYINLKELQAINKQIEELEWDR